MAAHHDQADMQTDFTPVLASNQDNGTGGPDGGDSTEGAAGGYVTSQLSELLIADVQNFFAEDVVPRAKAIEADIANMQYEAEVLTDKCATEKNEIDAELDRLSNAVMSFQQHIAKFLQFSLPG